MSGIAGRVSNVRELKRGVQADVVIGGTAEYGWVTINVVSSDPRVVRAMDVLKDVLRDVASQAIRAAQDDEASRGRKPIGHNEMIK